MISHYKARVCCVQRFSISNCCSLFKIEKQICSGSFLKNLNSTTICGPEWNNDTKALSVWLWVRQRLPKICCISPLGSTSKTQHRLEFMAVNCWKRAQRISHKNVIQITLIIIRSWILSERMFYMEQIGLICRGLHKWNVNSSTIRRL